MNNSLSILDIRFEHKYFILHTFLTTRPFTYINSIVKLALYNDHSIGTGHACTCMIIVTKTYTKFTSGFRKQVDYLGEKVHFVKINK